MKKIFRLLVMLSALLLALSFSACAKKETRPTTSESSTTASSTEDKKDDTEEEKEVEGTPISLPTPIDYTWGKNTVRSEWLKFAEEPYVVNGNFTPQIAAVGDYLIVLTDKTKLSKYKIDGGTLKLEDSWTLDRKYETLSQGPDNTFFVSGFMSPLIQMDLSGKKLASYSDADCVKLKPDGKDGVGFFAGEPKKITVSDTKATKEELSDFKGHSIGDADVSKNHLFMMGRAPEGQGERHKVFVLDYEYKLVHTLGNESDKIVDDTLGSVNGVIETDKYYVLLDGNFRQLGIWDKEGNFVGIIKDEDIFGTDYPWLSTCTVADDGSMYIGLTEQRKEENSKYELLIFKVSGF